MKVTGRCGYVIFAVVCVTKCYILFDFYECLSENIFTFIYQQEEKSKFDGIFESLAPVNGLLSGEKVKPVLINSKLPVDVLGKVEIHSLKLFVDKNEIFQN